LNKKNHISFNVAHISGNETRYINKAVLNKKLSGNGIYTKKCHKKFKNLLNNQHNLLTTSCTDALEMSAVLAEILPGDEVIMPTYTFVSTANAFILRGAKIKFIDSRNDHPGMDEDKIEELITKKNKINSSCSLRWCSLRYGQNKIHCQQI
jgi:dTDP-4-amino-4,6-dideoxygalactose transaminase